MIGDALIRPQVAERAPLFRPPGYWTDFTIVDYLEQAARQAPDRLALVDQTSRLTFQQYLERVQRLASWFVRQGLTGDDVIAIQVPNCWEFAVAMSAAVAAGVPFCQFHSGFSKEEARFVLRHIEARAVVVPTEFRGRDYVAMVDELRSELPALELCLSLGASGRRDWHDFRALCVNEEPDSSLLATRKPSADSAMRVAFTSGTTSDPKAVLHTHNSSLGSMRLINIPDWRITGDSVILVFLPVGLNWGLHETMRGAIAGCRLVYMETFDASRAVDLIEQEQVTHISAAPTALISLMEAPNFSREKLRSLEVVVVGGTPCPPVVAEQWRAKAPGLLMERYGMLEIGTGARTVATDDPADIGPSVGTVSPDGEVRIIDEAGSELPVGEIGEILFRGPGVAFGYYKNPAATQESFLPGGWFRTGDLGYLDDRNRLYIVGRRKEMLIRGGANVYPREVEEALLWHPQVADCAVVGVPDDRVGEKVAAVVVPRSGEQVTLESVREFLSTRIASYKLPEHLYLAEVLPRTPTGKVQRHQISLGTPDDTYTHGSGNGAGG